MDISVSKILGKYIILRCLKTIITLYTKDIKGQALLYSG